MLKQALKQDQDQNQVQVQVHGHDSKPGPGPSHDVDWSPRDGVSMDEGGVGLFGRMAGPGTTLQVCEPRSLCPHRALTVPVCQAPVLPPPPHPPSPLVAYRLDSSNTSTD